MTKSNEATRWLQEQPVMGKGFRPLAEAVPTEMMSVVVVYRDKDAWLEACRASGQEGRAFKPKDGPLEFYTRYYLPEAETPERATEIRRTIMDALGVARVDGQVVWSRPWYGVLVDGPEGKARVVAGLKYPVHYLNRLLFEDREEVLCHLLPELAASVVYGDAWGRRAYKAGFVLPHVMTAGLTDEGAAAVRVLTVPIPRWVRDREEWGQKPWDVWSRCFRRFLLTREPSLASVSGDAVTAVYRPGGTWLDCLEGWEISCDGKEQKRLKALTSTTPLRFSTASPLVVKEVEAEPGLLDGIFSVDEELLAEASAEALFREKDRPKPTAREYDDQARLLSRRHESWTAGQCRAEAKRRLERRQEESRARFRAYVNEARGCRLFSCRVFRPGLPMIKGVAMVVRGLKERTGADILTSPENCKGQVKGGDTWEVVLTPQGPKDREACLSVQAILAHPTFFRRQLLELCVRRDTARVVWEVQNGKMDKDLDAQLAKELDGDNALVPGEEGGGNGTQPGYVKETLWNALRWVEAGWGLTHSPTLCERLTKGKLGTLVFDSKDTADSYERDQGGGRIKFNFHIPCSRVEQVVSYTALVTLTAHEVPAARLFPEPDYGTIRRCPEYGLSVVSDGRWKDMIPSHGGCDEDDKFSLVFCRDSSDHGRPKVFVWRHPTDRGEYTVLDVHPGDLADGLYPRADRYEMAEDGVTAVRKVNDIESLRVDFSKLPGRVSDNLRAGGLVVTGFEFSKKKDRLAEPGPYDMCGLLAAVRKVTLAPPVGVAANAVMFRNACMPTREARGVIKETCEKLIDMATQAVEPEAYEEYVAYAEQLVAEALAGCGYRVDRVLLTYKYASWKRTEVAVEGGRKVRKFLGWFAPGVVPEVTPVNGTLTWLRDTWLRQRLLARQAVSAWVAARKVMPPAVARARPEEKELAAVRRRVWELMNSSRSCGWGKERYDAAMDELRLELLGRVVSGEVSILGLARAAWDCPYSVRKVALTTEGATCDFQEMPQEKEVWGKDLFELYLEAIGVNGGEDNKKEVEVTNDTRVVNRRAEAFDVYIGRGPGGCHMLNTPVGQDGWLGNPIRLTKDTPEGRAAVLKEFEKVFLDRLDGDAAFADAVLRLKGKRLGCFCKPKACHGDIIAAWLDAQETGTADRRSPEPPRPAGNQEFDEKGVRALEAAVAEARKDIETLASGQVPYDWACGNPDDEEVLFRPAREGRWTPELWDCFQATCFNHNPYGGLYPGEPGAEEASRLYELFGKEACKRVRALLKG